MRNCYPRSFILHFIKYRERFPNGIAAKKPTLCTRRALPLGANVGLQSRTGIITQPHFRQTHNPPYTQPSPEADLEKIQRPFAIALTIGNRPFFHLQ